jgi:hypothetical protein
VFGNHVRIFGYPLNIGAHRVSAEEHLTMPPQKKSKKNIPAETNREGHHPPQGNEISFILNLPTPQIKNGEQNSKL